MLWPHEFFESDLLRAHRRSIRHFGELWQSGLCGCFYCLDIFEFKDIQEWIDDGHTALCPNCGIDSVIGDASGFPITEEFLVAMRARWFGMSASNSPSPSLE